MWNFWKKEVYYFVLLKIINWNFDSYQIVGNNLLRSVNVSLKGWREDNGPEKVRMNDIQIFWNNIDNETQFISGSLVNFRLQNLPKVARESIPGPS